MTPKAIRKRQRFPHPTLPDGTFFYLPLTDGRFTIGLVAMRGNANDFLGYYFNRVFDVPPTLDDACRLTPRDTVLIKIASDWGFRIPRWVVLGQCEHWDPSTWPIPTEYSSFDPLTNEPEKWTFNPPNFGRATSRVPCTQAEADKLPWASTSGWEALENILSKKLLKNPYTTDGPLLPMVLRGDLSEVETLLQAGADPDERDVDGRTPLMQAVIDGNQEMAAVLLRYSTNVNAQDRNLWTSLHFAAQRNDADMTLLLIKAGAWIDTPEIHGNTPLATAVFNSRGNGHVISILLSHGADRHHPNLQGVSPLQLAEQIANYDVVRFFKAHHEKAKN